MLLGSDRDFQYTTFPTDIRKVTDLAADQAASAVAAASAISSVSISSVSISTAASDLSETRSASTCHPARAGSVARTCFPVLLLFTLARGVSPEMDRTVRSNVHVANPTIGRPADHREVGSESSVPSNDRSPQLVRASATLLAPGQRPWGRNERRIVAERLDAIWQHHERDLLRQIPPQFRRWVRSGPPIRRHRVVLRMLKQRGYGVSPQLLASAGREVKR